MKESDKLVEEIADEINQAIDENGINTIDVDLPKDDRPYKCKHTFCKYYVKGFKMEKGRSIHYGRDHKEETEKEKLEQEQEEQRERKGSVLYAKAFNPKFMNWAHEMLVRGLCKFGGVNEPNIDPEDISLFSEIGQEMIGEYVGETMAKHSALIEWFFMLLLIPGVIIVEDKLGKVFNREEHEGIIYEDQENNDKQRTYKWDNLRK